MNSKFRFKDNKLIRVLLDNFFFFTFSFTMFERSYVIGVTPSPHLCTPDVTSHVNNCALLLRLMGHTIIYIYIYILIM